MDTDTDDVELTLDVEPEPDPDPDPPLPEVVGDPAAEAFARLEGVRNRNGQAHTKINNTDWRTFRP